MAGGHLDSGTGTGATDNAAGVAAMMEAVRIIKSLGIAPKRTIRIALWSGEEQGLLGSIAYVKAHFGSAEAPKPEHAKFNGYLNIDTGTGRLRGASVFGPPETAAILRDILAPFKDLKIFGATRRDEPRHRRTDHTASTTRPARHRLRPGTRSSTGSHTHHTNLDTYERVIEADVRDAAASWRPRSTSSRCSTTAAGGLRPTRCLHARAPRGGGQ